MGRRPRLTPAGRWLLAAGFFEPVAFQLHVLIGDTWMHDRVAFLLGMGLLVLLLNAGNGLGFLTSAAGACLFVGAVGAYAEQTPLFRFGAGSAQLVIVIVWLELWRYWQLEFGTLERRIVDIGLGFSAVGMAWFVLVNLAPSGAWAPHLPGVHMRVFGVPWIEAALGCAMWLALAIVLVHRRRSSA